MVESSEIFPLFGNSSVSQEPNRPARPEIVSMEETFPAGTAQSDHWAERKEDRAMDWLNVIVGYRLQEPPLASARESPTEYGEDCILCFPQYLVA